MSHEQYVIPEASDGEKSDGTEGMISVDNKCHCSLCLYYLLLTFTGGGKVRSL